MNCVNTCVVAGAFFIASLYTSLVVDKEGIIDPYFNLLDIENRERYKKIGDERRMLQMKGLVLGFSLAVAILVYNGRTSINISTMCDALAITFVTNYFFYLLYPKSDYMVLHLDKKEEREAWLNVYRTMQFNYNSSLALGLIGLFVLLRK